MCVEPFSDYPPLGRFAVRDMRQTVLSVSSRPPPPRRSPARPPRPPRRPTRRSEPMAAVVRLVLVVGLCLLKATCTSIGKSFAGYPALLETLPIIVCTCPNMALGLMFGQEPGGG